MPGRKLDRFNFVNQQARRSASAVRLYKSKLFVIIIYLLRLNSSKVMQALDYVLGSRVGITVSNSPNPPRV